MAGAGKRTFIAGEVLTAAQVNDYLMDQAVMRFSGSAARAASITAPTEGMFTYLDDTNSLEFYDGAGWQPADLRRFVTGSAQVLIGAAAGSIVSLGGAAEGQILTAASAQPGGLTWSTPQGAGAAAYFSVSASGQTSIGETLSAGFYEIVLGNGSSYTDTQFRLVDANGGYYGATVTSGLAFTTIPVDVVAVDFQVASVSTGVLLREIPAVTSQLPTSPSVTSFAWSTIFGGSVSYTVPAGTQTIGYYQTNTGAFYDLSSSAGSTDAASVVNPFSTSNSASFGEDYTIAVVARNAAGKWSTAIATTASALATVYPYALFTANGTYTPTTASVDVAIVAGGGGGGGSANDGAAAGGGGAGGVRYLTNLAVTGAQTVTVGAGGAGQGSANGSNGGLSAFGSASATGGGGGGGGSVPRNGQNGGSGGGNGSAGATVGTGNVGGYSPVEGYAGGGNAGAGGGGGGGWKEAGDTDGAQQGGDGDLVFGWAVGGGAGGSTFSTAGTGGFGGGGNGGTGNAGTGKTAGQAFTGGGGGGTPGNNEAGANGGTGIVIVKALL